MRRPPTEQEIALLIRALEPVELAEGQGRATRAVTEGSPLPKERMAVLMSDVTALLAELHARETLGRLMVAPGITSALRARTAKALEGVRDCVRARFAERGGERAFADSTRLVERHRAALERALLESPRSRP